MYLPDAPTRANMISFFRNHFRLTPPGRSLWAAPLPNFLLSYVRELVMSKGCPWELALLATIDAFVAADAGRTHVKTSDGRRNSLSKVTIVSAEAGVGKSSAHEEAQAVFAEFDRKRQKEIQEENKEIEFQNSLLHARQKELLKVYGKSLSEEYVAELREIRDEIRPLKRFHPHLLVDTTAAAYSQHVIETGRGIRLECDGVMLPGGTLRQVTKGWSSEGAKRSRVTMPEGQNDAPFILEHVMTQPGNFHQYINSFSNDDSGMMTRMLLYKYEGNAVPFMNLRPMCDHMRSEFRSRLLALLEASYKVTEDGMNAHRVISVSPEAEQLLANMKVKWDGMAVQGGFCYRIRNFMKRMPQHAIRLAGCLHLTEFNATSKEPISLQLMEGAVQLAEVFADQMLRWSIKDYEDVNAECCRTVMLFVLQKNFDIVSETLLKQAVKNKFCAADVSVALEYLLAEGYLHERLPLLPVTKGERKAGRPTGRDFVNPYFAPYESSF